MFQTAFRWIVMSALGITATFFLLMAVALPLLLISQAAEDRDYYQQFRQAAAYVHSHSLDHGQLAEGDLVPMPGVSLESREANGLPEIRMAKSCLYNDGFEIAPGDQFMLSLWRGEWDECYAYPSGKTTLPRSVLGYLFEGYGLWYGSFWIVGLGAAWIVWSLRRRDHDEGYEGL